MKKITLSLIHLIIGILCIIFFPIINRKSRKNLIKLWSLLLLKIFNINLIVNHDLKKILAKKNYLIVSNHISWLDIFVINTAHPVTFVAKQSISEWPILNWLVKASETIFIDRKISSLKIQESKIIKHLNKKKNLVIFPEGTSSDGNEVLPFKSSLFNIFEKNLNAKISIQTITIIYKKINGIAMNRIDRKNITWHSNMDLIPNIFNVLKKLSIEVEIIFNKEFLPNKGYDRKKLALHCWEKISYNLTNSLYRK